MSGQVKTIDVESRLNEIGLALPAPPAPVGSYKAFVRAGNLLFISGQLPLVDGAVVFRGQIGADLTAADGYQASRICALNVLAQIRKALGGFERLLGVVRVDGYINAAPTFFDLPQVLNGASDLFSEVLAEKAGHARTVAAHCGLPMNAAVELGVIVEIQ